MTIKVIVFFLLSLVQNNTQGAETKKELPYTDMIQFCVNQLNGENINQPHAVNACSCYLLNNIDKLIKKELTANQKTKEMNTCLNVTGKKIFAFNKGVSNGKQAFVSS